jgi:hypothetical protein
VHLERQLGYQRFKPGVFTLDFLYFSPGSIPGYISGEPFFASLHEVLQSGIVSAGANAFPMAEVPDGGVAAKAFENNAYLLLGSELAAGDTLDVTDKLLGF